jgi:hypothetical protein
MVTRMDNPCYSFDRKCDIGYLNIEEGSVYRALALICNSLTEFNMDFSFARKNIFQLKSCCDKHNKIVEQIKTK